MSGARAVWGRPVRSTPGQSGQSGQVYFDYDLQVWVVRGHVARCGHPSRPEGGYCCNAAKYALLWIEEARRLEGLPAVAPVGAVLDAGEAEDDMERARR